MTAVLTTTMTLRIILSVRGSLAQGGSYAGSSISSSNRGNSTHVLSSSGRPHPNPPNPASFGPTASSFGVQSNNNGVINIGGYGAPERKGSLSGPAGVVDTKNGAFTLDEMRDKAARGDWDGNGSDGRSSVIDGKEGEAYGAPNNGRYDGVKVTIDREVDYHGRK
jgi:hypothetical protein